MVPAPPEFVIVIAIGLLLFGSYLLPKWGRAAGETIGEIRGRTNIRDDKD